MRFVRQIDEMDCGAACLAMIAGPLRPHGLARAHPAAGEHRSRRDEPAIALQRGRGARTRRALRQGVTAQPRSHAAARHLPLGRRPLARAVPRHRNATHSSRIPRSDSAGSPREEFERRWTGYAALFDYTAAFEQAPRAAPRPRPGCGRSSSRIERSLAKALALAVVVSVLQMVLPVFTQIIVDRVLVEQDLSLLRLLIVAMGGTMVFIVASLLAQRYLLSFVAVRVDAAGLDFITRRLLALPMSYFATRRTGDLQRRIDGMRQVRDVLVQHGIAGVTAVGQLTVTVVIMAAYSPWLTTVFLATAPLYALLMYSAVRWLRPTFYDLEDAYGRYHSYQVDAIKGIETVKAVGGEPMFRQLMLGTVPGRGAQAVQGRLPRDELRRSRRSRDLPRARALSLGGRACRCWTAS